MNKLLISLFCIFLLSSCGAFKKSIISEVDEILLEEFESTSEEDIMISEENVTVASFKLKVINKSKFGTYPAVFLDLTTDELLQVDADNFDNQAASFGKALFIEPRDPKLKVFDAKSKDTKNIVLPISFNFVTAEYIASHSFMSSNELSNSQIKKGVVFGTKFLDGSVYKFEILEFNKDKQEITLKYQQLK